MSGTSLFAMSVMAGMNSITGYFTSYFGSLGRADWIMLILQFLLIVSIAYDIGYRDWMSKGQLYLLLILVVFLPLIGAVVYLAVVVFTEAQMPDCPKCQAPLTGNLKHCDSCGYDVEEMRERRRMEDKEEFECEMCGKTFSTLRGVLEHKANHGSGDEDNDSEEGSQENEGFMCDGCGRTFSSSRGLNIHRSSKHE